MPPVVDLKQASAARSVAESLCDSGFAVVTNHPISLESLQDFYGAWEDFFLHGNKEGFPADAHTQAGYFSPKQAETAKGNAAQDLKEYFQYWPDGPIPDNLRKLTNEFYNTLFLLSSSILEGLQHTTSPELWRRLERPLSSCLSSADTMIRILRYPPLTGSEPAGAIRAGAHEDINFITLLPTATMPGLEIKPEGSNWQPVEAPPGAIIINIGDMLQELTNGALPSTSHRVINPEGEDAKAARVTAPLFCHPYPEMVLSDRYTAGEYLLERLTEISPIDVRPDFS